MSKNDKIVNAALKLRDECIKEMEMCLKDPETFGDPGDAFVCISGCDKNANSVLFILQALGVPIPKLKD